MYRFASSGETRRDTPIEIFQPLQIVEEQGQRVLRSGERRFGHFLHNKKRGDYLLSSKVGKLFKASKNNRHAEIYPLSDSPNDIVFDYTADGVRRSIEDSLQRLGVDSLDVAFVHDISPDFAYFPNGWEEQYQIARKGAFPALSKMRDEGIIRA